jgi:lipopolysaccharide transport system permease protein
LSRPIWHYRDFTFNAIKNDLMVRFARSRLGTAWMIINPLAQVAIYAIILSRVLGADIPGISSKYAYAIYLMAGQLAWTAFSDTILRSQNLFIDNASLLSKIHFPRLVLLFVSSGIALLNAAAFFAVILVIFVLLGHIPTWHAMLIPALLALTLLLAQAIGLITALLNVFYRDIGQVVPIILQFGFWLTPVVYRPDILPDVVRPVLHYNPMFHVVRAFQDVLVFHRIPDLMALTGVFACSVALLGIGLFLFHRANPELSESL